jgi:hypothetical protein
MLWMEVVCRLLPSRWPALLLLLLPDFVPAAASAEHTIKSVVLVLSVFSRKRSCFYPLVAGIWWHLVAGMACLSDIAQDVGQIEVDGRR